VYTLFLRFKYLVIRRVAVPEDSAFSDSIIHLWKRRAKQEINGTGGLFLNLILNPKVIISLSVLHTFGTE
jgi:hypothetical protein